MSPVLISHPADGVTLLTINRPERRNALSRQTALDLGEALAAFERAPEQRVAVLTGAGNDAFCAGADLTDPPEFWRCTPGVGVEVTKPLIAAVAGWCVGGGLVLTMLCDLAIAAENAVFSYPEANVGVSGGMAASLLARMPHKIAMELLLACNRINAQRAYDVGFVNQLVPVGQQVDTAVALAQRMAGHAPLVMRMLKKHAQSVLTRSPAEDATRTMAEISRIRESEDAAEGKLAFREKRKPVFKGM